MRREDTFTSTVDAAQAFERRYSDWEPYDDRPSLSDLADDWHVEPEDES